MGYCTIAQIRAEGVPSTGYGAKSDEYIQNIIDVSSLMIDSYTGRFFEARDLTITVDGTGKRVLPIRLPIIRIDSVKIGEDFDSVDAIDSSAYRVYNRHMTQELTDEDDRNNPRIEFLRTDQRTDGYASVQDEYSYFLDYRFPKGTQNVQLVGTFGYTDYDDSEADGVTPTLITRACVLMTVRDIYTSFSEVDMRYDSLNRHRITEMRTRDQSITMQNKFVESADRRAPYTGVPQIDQILMKYTRPIRVTGI